MICLMALALLAGDAAAQDEGSKIVSHGPQGYSVDASQTNVVQVLTEMGQHAGFTVEAPDTFNSPITLSLQDAPLDQVLRRVLRDENYIIVYRGGVQKTTISGEGIDKIFLLSPATAQANKPAAANGASPLAGPGAAAQRPGAPGHGAPPPPPPPAGGDADIAARSARARAQAEAHRAALAENPGRAGVGPGGARRRTRHDARCGAHGAARRGSPHRRTAPEPEGRGACQRRGARRRGRGRRVTAPRARGPRQATRLIGLPARKARTLATVVAIRRRRAARLAQAMCGVMMQFGRRSSGLSARDGSRGDDVERRAGDPARVERRAPAPPRRSVRRARC